MQESGIPRQVQPRQPGRETEMTPAPDYAPRFAGSGRLKGKTALITGGDSGIGRATAVLFAREGASIAFHYKDEHQDAADTIDAIRQEGAEVIALHGDIGDIDEVKRLVRGTVAAFGHIGVLINNAGEQHTEDRVEDISEAQLQRTFATNFFAQFHLVQEVVAEMRAGDAIVNVSSVTAFRGHETLVDYASSKGAILAFTRALSAQLSQSRRCLPAAVRKRGRPRRDRPCREDGTRRQPTGMAARVPPRRGAGRDAGEGSARPGVQ